MKCKRLTSSSYRVLNTYLVSLKGQLLPEQKEKLAVFVKNHVEEAGGDAALAEKWSLGTEDIVGLKKALALA